MNTMIEAGTGCCESRVRGKMGIKYLALCLSKCIGYRREKGLRSIVLDCELFEARDCSYP